MRKYALIILFTFILIPLHASKLSHFLHKHHEREKAREQKEFQQDMNFSDYSFRLERRYTERNGEQCRVYQFRSRSNPYRHGKFSVCEEHL